MIRGERFELNLDSDDEESIQETVAPPPSLFVKDVLERQPKSPAPPSAPKIKSKTGFPEHRKHDVRSRFKQRQMSGKAEDVSTANTSSAPTVVPQSDDNRSNRHRTWEEEEKMRIDQENRQRLADMSPEQIEEERRELMNALSPGLLQKLLRRSNLESGSNEADLSSPVTEESTRDDSQVSKPRKTVKFEEPKSEDLPSSAVNDDDELPSTDVLPHDSVHFPRPPQPPDLDPSSESFFDDLHQKYFPSLPQEPDKLEWMQSSTTPKVLYDPSVTSMNASEIRFSFSGDILAPKTAAEIPVIYGLHHHGDAPDSAGYTIPELAHLARSTYPAQRCIAFQTLGRILYRLSKKEFGDPDEGDQDLPGEGDTMGTLAKELWKVVEKTHIIQTLTVESEGNGVDGGRHVSAKAYAIEALWLWQRGGGRRWKAE